jgi:hypothetical protein
LSTEPTGRAELCLNSWAGFRTVSVIVVGETPKRYRIEAPQNMRLPGRNCHLRAGERTLVPRAAIRFRDK